MRAALLRAAAAPLRARGALRGAEPAGGGPVPPGEEPGAAGGQGRELYLTSNHTVHCLSRRQQRTHIFRKKKSMYKVYTIHSHILHGPSVHGAFNFL